MTGRAESADTQLDRGSRGALVLVVGASGVGKDTLIGAARRHFRDDERFLFPQRVITRTDQTGEAHVAVSAVEFESMLLAGAFFLSWEAHGLKYGIPITARGALEAGCNVVVNVSRAIVEEARRHWGHVRVVHVTVGPEILRERLVARRREAQAAVEARLAREVQIAATPLVDYIDNSGDLAGAVQRFTALLDRYAERRRGPRSAREGIIPAAR